MKLSYYECPKGNKNSPENYRPKYAPEKNTVMVLFVEFEKGKYEKYNKQIVHWKHFLRYVSAEKLHRQGLVHEKKNWEAKEKRKNYPKDRLQKRRLETYPMRLAVQESKIHN